MTLFLHHIHRDRSFLPEPPAPTDALVILLEGVGRKKGHVIAVLEIQTPCTDRRLCDQYPYLSIGKGKEFFLLLFVTVPA